MFDSLHRRAIGALLKRVVLHLGTATLLLVSLVTPAAAVELPVATGVKPTPASVAPGTPVHLASTFLSPTTMNNVNIDLEVRDGANRRVFQKWFSGQTLTASQSSGYSATWAMPKTAPLDTYTIKTGVFSADWTIGYGWNNNADKFKVGLNQPTEQPTTPVADGPTAGNGPGFYVDCTNGRDSNAGSTAITAWATLGRANRANLKPGDTLWLKRGCTWTQSLNAPWNGTAAQPITITAYGNGALPTIVSTTEEVTISGSYVVLDGVSLRANPDHYDPGCNNQAVGYRVGVQLPPGSHHNTVRNSTFSSLSMGIFVDHGSNNNSINHNTFDKVNMMFTLTPVSVNNWDDAGAQAMLLEGDYNDVGYNTVSGSIACSYDFITDGAVVEVFGGSHNTIHHNYSENTDIFSEVTMSSAVGNVFSYNIANGHSAMTIHADTSGTKVYNNVFYSTGGSGENGIVCGGCSPGTLTFKNNILWAYGAISTNGAAIDEGYNVYWAPNGNPYFDFQRSSTSKVADPLFANPGSDFRLLAGSPAIGAGTMDSVAAGFKSDFAGRPVPGASGGVESGSYAF